MDKIVIEGTITAASDGPISVKEVFDTSEHSTGANKDEEHTIRPVRFEA